MNDPDKNTKCREKNEIQLLYSREHSVCEHCVVRVRKA